MPVLLVAGYAYALRLIRVPATAEQIRVRIDSRAARPLTARANDTANDRIRTYILIHAHTHAPRHASANPQGCAPPPEDPLKLLVDLADFAVHYQANVREAAASAAASAAAAASTGASAGPLSPAPSPGPTTSYAPSPTPRQRTPGRGGAGASAAAGGPGSLPAGVLGAGHTEAEFRLLDGLVERAAVLLDSGGGPNLFPADIMAELQRQE